MTFEIEIPDLQSELRNLIKQIPHGRVTTYAALAEALGSDSATRWVGGFVLEPHSVADLPVHRIVRSGGEVGLYYTANAQDKIRLLESEEVEVAGGCVDLGRCLFEEFDTVFPLHALRTMQQELALQSRFSAPSHPPKTIAGVDVSYLSEGEAVGGYALIDAGTAELAWSTTVRAPIRFPYIPTFLAFRELPVLLDLLQAAEQAGHSADVVFVDGSGLLHNRRMGIACMLGILAGVPSVGVSKKLLCGKVDLDGMQADESREIVHEGELLGRAVKSRATSKPIYVSPGHLIDVETSTELVQQLFHGHRLPEPTFWADKLSREAVKAHKQPAG